MSALLGRRRVLVAIILVLVAIVATESVVLAVTTVRQGSVEYMKVATATVSAYTTSTQWTDVGETALSMPIPNGEHDFFQITFSAGNMFCQKTMGGAAAGICYVRALVDGVEVAPGPALFGYSGSLDPDLAHTMTWVSGVLAPGTHYVKIQFAVANTDNELGIYMRTTTVVRVRAY